MNNKNRSNGKAPEAEVVLQEEPKTEKSEVQVSENGQLHGGSEVPQTPLTVEEKIKKVSSLQELIKVRAIMKSHLEKVEALKFGDFEEKDIVTITSGNNQSYTIKSPLLCNKFKLMATKEISEFIAEVEAQINF